MADIARRRPHDAEYVRLTSSNRDEMVEWIRSHGGDVPWVDQDGRDFSIRISPTRHEAIEYQVSVGDYVVLERDGFHLYDPPRFTTLYETEV
ncbi:hypothetical protein [Saccharopolyspora antimicrobica]|nr:hypothetical protein [Saccharopolyspora antimicrobica]